MESLDDIGIPTNPLPFESNQPENHDHSSKKSEHKSVDQKNDKDEERQDVGRIDQVWNKLTRKWEYLETSPTTPETKSSKYVILIRRVMDRTGFPQKTEVDIKGPLLQKALLDVNQGRFALNFDQEPPVIDPSILYHSREGLTKLHQQTKDEPENQDLLFELDAALKYISEEFADTLKAVEALSAQKGEITFNLLWTLFLPDTVICGVGRLDELVAYTFHSGRFGQDLQGNKFYTLTVTNYDYNGKFIGRTAPTTLQIYEFPAAMKIANLKYVPLNLHPDAQLLRQFLLERGEMALKLYKRQVVEYHGDHALREGSRGTLVKFNVHGRIILDPEVYTQTKPTNTLVPAVQFAVQKRQLIPSNQSTVSKSQLTEDQIIQLSPVVYGFSLGDKMWGAFAVSKIKDTVWNHQIFDSLVLDEEYRNFIHDLVQAHQSRENSGFDDIVRDKGKGLIGLLSGPPGVGKTLTAEAVAEVTERPLYMISSGELGEEPSVIHTKLTEILELAELWDAVLLLDEADVFLAERDNSNLTRNAIASIFLRELEYYRGILILTTNRLKTFDPAFQSRIHFCITYPDLDTAGREQIWATFVDKARANPNVDIDIDEEGLKVLAKLPLNGRQIKNSMSISQAVAMKREEKLGIKGILTAIKLSQSWGSVVQLVGSNN